MLKPPPFEYFSPTNLAEAVRLVSTLDNARLLAGGQSLMAMMNMRYIYPDQIIDLNRVSELDFIRNEGDEIVIGSMTRQRAIAASLEIEQRLPLLPKALRYVGHLQTRSRGTIGGSLCQLDPSAELPAVSMSYDAIVEIEGPNSRRSVGFAELPLMYMTTTLAPNEILTAVRFKPWTGIVGSGFREFSRRHGDYAIAGAMTLLRAAQNGTIERAVLTIFGVAEAPIRVAAAETLLLGQRPERHLLRQAALHSAALATLDDPYCSADYRGHVAAAMAEDALVEAVAELNLL